MHMPIHAYMHTRMHDTCVHKYMYAYMHVRINTYACMHQYMYTYIHALTHVTHTWNITTVVTMAKVAEGRDSKLKVQHE